MESTKYCLFCISTVSDERQAFLQRLRTIDLHLPSLYYNACTKISQLMIPVIVDNHAVDTRDSDTSSGAVV